MISLPLPWIMFLLNSALWAEDVDTLVILFTGVDAAQSVDSLVSNSDLNTLPPPPVPHVSRCGWEFLTYFTHT